jgi:hypothetical protein
MSHAAATSPTLSLRADVVATVLDDGAVLLDLDTKFFYSVNQSGWAVLQLFESGATRDDVTSRCHASGATTPEAAAALGAFIDTLIAERLISANGQPSASVSIVWPRLWSTPTIEKHREPLQRIMSSAFDPTLPLAE